MSLNTVLLLVHETLSFDLGVQTLAGLHGQHNEAVFSANWFKMHALSNNTLLSVLTRVNAETRKGCQSVIASASEYQVDDKQPSCSRRGGAPSLS